MGRTKFYCAGITEAATQAAILLRKQGISFGQIPSADITDVLLDVPSYSKTGMLRNGDDPEILFSRLSPGIRVWGGNLLPGSGMIPFDLLKDHTYLAENAAITADCTLKIAAPLLQTTWNLTHVLIIGWGRIGKHLCKLLKPLGADITVCARKASDRALIKAFGYHPQTPSALLAQTAFFELIINTAPAVILGPDTEIKPDCVAIDLASTQGLTLPHVIWARGLPGKLAPKASGALIAQSILRIGKEMF